MGYLLWFSVVIISFVIMHYFTELRGRQKLIITLVVTLLVLGAVMYNIQSDRDREHVSAIELKFTHGETIVCQGVTVNTGEFSYSVGTQSFIGNKGTSHYQQIFNARECR